MFSVWTVAGIVLSYLFILFALAFWGDRRIDRNKQHPIVYSLALGVHCTSWAFFGTTTQAAQYGWAFIPTYLGIILVMLFAFPLLRRIAQLCHQYKISSLADFIGLQYQKSHLLAAIISVLCFFGVVPYIALQLDAVTWGFALITQDKQQWPGSIGLYVTTLMALFAILFGTRSISLTDKHPGLMLAIAFESVVKLTALLAVGLFVIYVLFDGLFDLLGQAQSHPQAKEIVYAESGLWVYGSHMLLGICAMFCLPRQFHINFIENNGEEELRLARWAFPAYLIAITVFVLPIALAGHILFQPGTTSTDTYALALPILGGNESITLVSFIGGLSAATSMVIVATLAVGIMISNNLMTPLWLKFKLTTGKQKHPKPATLLFIRRLTIVIVLGIAYLYHKDVSQGAPLVKSGIISIALLSQTLPLIIFGMYWPKRSKNAALIALIAGALCWFYWLLWPSIKASYYFDPAPTDMQLAQGFIYSLLANISCFLVFSWLLPDKNKQTSLHRNQQHEGLLQQAVKISNLLALTNRVLTKTQQQNLLKIIGNGQHSGYASPKLIDKVESEIAGQVGSASARILITAVAEKEHVALPQLVELVEEASQTFQFNHELLQSSVEHIQQGISVLDRNMRLLAWNQRYVEMFNYPRGFIQVGMSIRDILTFNAQRGMLGSVTHLEEEIEKRINYMQQGSRYKYLRTQQDGRVIELNGSPLPGGGFVTTYSDISEYIDIQHQLEEAKSNLEERVEKRTQQLKEANIALESAKLEADAANESKTKFLAAAGHDLMQPFNAASLFASMLQQKASSSDITELSDNLVQSLNSAEELLSMLLDMTRLESGVLKAHVQAFPVDEILAPLTKEFQVIAKQKGLTLRYRKSTAIVVSDKKLLRRIIQNLISNAIRYTPSGKILVGLKRKGSNGNICVLDTGPGIAIQHQQQIFDEFSQLDNDNNKQGLGLGLTIVDRISSLLNHPVKLLSQVDKGTQFSVGVPLSNIAKTSFTQSPTKPIESSLFLTNTRILVIENEPQTMQAVSALLESWGAKVIQATSIESAREAASAQLDLMLLDYHLDHGETGIEVALAVREQFATSIPGILNSANRGEEIRQQATEANLLFLPKPLKPAAFKRLIKQLL